MGDFRRQTKIWFIVGELNKHFTNESFFGALWFQWYGASKCVCVKQFYISSKELTSLVEQQTSSKIHIKTRQTERQALRNLETCFSVSNADMEC